MREHKESSAGLCTAFRFLSKYVPVSHAFNDEAYDRQDAINTHPTLGMPTTVGSFALVNARPAENAGVVEEARFPSICTFWDGDTDNILS